MTFEKFLASLSARIETRRAVALAVWAGVLASGALGVTAALLLSGARLGSPYAVAALAMTALLAERQCIRLSPTAEVSVGSLIFVFAAVTFGPLAAVIVGAAGLLVDFRRPLVRWVIWTGSRTLVAAACGMTALAFHAPATHSFGLLVAAVIATAIVEAVTDLALAAVTPVLRGTGTFGDLLGTSGPLLIASVPLQAPVIAVLAYAYREISPWSAVLFVVPAFAAQRLFVLYRRQRDTAEELEQANQRLEKANLSFATALVATLDARDRYTAGHSAAVAIYARDIALRLGLSEEQQQLAHLCGLVHDIGKIGLPAGLLEKPGALTLEERRIMEQHAAIGERILANVDDYAEIAAIVRHHHERVDGQGYPDGLCGDEIPLLSRIIAVADAYNAMTSDRPYRDAMPSRVARIRLAQAVQSQFDTTVVAPFEAILAGATETYRSGSRADFRLEAHQHASLERVASEVA